MMKISIRMYVMYIHEIARFSDSRERWLIVRRRIDDKRCRTMVRRGTETRPGPLLRLGLIIVCGCWLHDFLGTAGFANAEKLRLCVVESAHPVRRVNRTCSKLRMDVESEVECVMANDRLSCLRRLVAGDAEFAVFEPEDLIVASANTEYDVLVTHELRLFQPDNHRFAMTAVVKADIQSSFDLMGKKFCHGGMENMGDSTRVFATYFQNWMIPRKCDRDKTLVENDALRLSTFFGSACIPGAWTQDFTYDNHLKSKYKNLCALCDNPEGCFHSDKYYGREGALLCLTENNADVAWVRLADALRHFKTQGINETRYSYLCPDGTTRTVGRGRPCVWISKPWPVVVATRDTAERVRKIVDSLNDKKFNWQIDVEQVMEAYSVTPVSLDGLLTPEDFIRRYPGFASANARSGCWPSRSIKWCVASNLEDRKCRWMREASLAYGLEPAISCIQQATRTACLEALRSGRVDIFVVGPEEELEARLKGLVPIVQATTAKEEDLNIVAALVKNDSRYLKLEDLRGARACFTGYRSIGWNAFVEAMSNATTNENWNCSDLHAVSSFFKDSCVFGLDGSKVNGPIPPNLYSQCQQGGKSMNATAATYDCLNSGKGDVAFVSLENGVKNNPGSLPSPGSNFRSISIDPADSKDSTSVLTWTELGSVMVNENMTELRREEIYTGLLEIDTIFGKRYPELTLAFSLYGPYDSSRNVIFSDRTQRLQRQVDHIRLPRNYAAIVDRFVERRTKLNYCNKTDRPGTTMYNAMTILLFVVVISTFVV